MWKHVSNSTCESFHALAKLPVYAIVAKPYISQILKYLSVFILELHESKRYSECQTLAVVI